MQYEQRLNEVERRYDELTRQMADPAIIGDSETYRKTTKAQSDLADLVSKYRQYKQVKQNLDEARLMLNEPDAEMRQMATEEIDRFGPELPRLEEELKVLL